MIQRALITGVSGFVGGFLAEHLLDAGNALLGCSPDGRWMPESPEALASRLELIAWNLGQPDGLSNEATRAIRRFAPNVIYHLAALSVPSQCGDLEPTKRAWAVNVEGTRQVLEQAASLPSRPRVLFVSSSHVYAPVTVESPRVTEDSPVGPLHGYGKTKLAAEWLALEHVAAGKADVVIVRAFQHTGPRQDACMMLPQWASQFAGNHGPVGVYTRDAQIDVTDVRDVVRAYRMLAEKGENGSIYNVGSGQSRRTGDILDLLRRLAGDDRAILETRPGPKQDPIADIVRLTTLTGWQPEIPLERTVADTLAYWRNRNN
ncbi:MAG: NAD-dependent epimerase/dehydratase family protein [Pirellulales bacterium]|nr:NAD-dependent epimerase/dehydratase family protein [Pirellulales bacterium]